MPAETLHDLVAIWRPANLRQVVVFYDVLVVDPCQLQIMSDNPYFETYCSSSAHFEEDRSN